MLALAGQSFGADGPVGEGHDDGLVIVAHPVGDFGSGDDKLILADDLDFAAGDNDGDPTLARSDYLRSQLLKLGAQVGHSFQFHSLRSPSFSGKRS